jgi:hypothetical protein
VKSALEAVPQQGQYIYPNVYMFINDGSGLDLWASATLPTTTSYQFSDYLYPNGTAYPAGATPSYTSPRIEAPAYIPYLGPTNPNGLALTTVPVWEQYSTNSTGPINQSLIWWNNVPN